MVQRKTINDVMVKPIPVVKIDKDHIRGHDLFPEIYANIFLLARKKSGKTNVINKILKSCADKNTKVVVFCSTCEKDSNWKAIHESLDKRKIENEFHQSIKDEGVDHLQDLMDEMRAVQSDEELSSSSEEEVPQILSFGDLNVEVKVKKRKPKFVSPKFIVVLDDISTELKHPLISHLLKTNRHMKCKVILSSQYLNDLLPMARRQIDFYLVFKGLNDVKLQELYNNADLNISFDEFKTLYDSATEERFNFLYVDSVNSLFRHNFNQSISL